MCLFAFLPRASLLARGGDGREDCPLTLHPSTPSPLSAAKARPSLKEEAVEDWGRRLAGGGAKYKYIWCLRFLGLSEEGMGTPLIPEALSYQGFISIHLSETHSL